MRRVKLMISYEKPNQAALRSIASSLHFRQPQLLEKVYRALSLLEGLAELKLDFIFKGGTTVMLLLGKTERFSIDIDIIRREPFDLHILSDIAVKKGFIDVSEQKRKPHGFLEKSHYLFSYVPLLKTGIDKETVLLDVLHEDNPYPEVVDTPVVISLFPNSGEAIRVRTPTLDSICGDKLTAFAPNTTGIP